MGAGGLLHARGVGRLGGQAGAFAQASQDQQPGRVARA